jgi:hypothetical protein
MKASIGKARQSRQSFALIATLAILTLLTIVLVAFVAMVGRDRSATQNYSQGIRADQIALGAIDQVVSQIQQEITDTTLSTVNTGTTGGSNMYMPLASMSAGPPYTNAVPQRMAPASLIPIVTMSGTNVYPGAPNLAAIGNSTANPSLNNRKITAARWTEPNLLLPAASNSFAAGTPPSWVIVTRNGPQGFPAGTTPQSAGLITSGLGNPTGAIGRYAYVVYDTSGLLDANVAGYPTSAAGSAAGKGSLPWAQLTNLPGVTSSDVQSLINWRNASTSGSYAANVQNAATSNGFMQVANGDTAFLSRQELIKWTQQSGNSDWQAALPYLTTFSREVNGPTWGPTTNMGTVNGTNFNYQTRSSLSGVQNPLIFNPRVQTPFTNYFGFMTVPGEPLVKYRFPLDKLNLFNAMAAGPLSATQKTQLQQYFGLSVETDSSGYYRHLDYPAVGRAGNSSTGILTLDQVAALGREPDFFELLQAGLLQGSLGTSGYSGLSARWDILNNGHRLYPAGGAPTYTPPPVTDEDPSITFQVLKIGANIIDQWHTDNYPTTISFPTPAGTTGSENVYGICDLPYINQMWLKVYQPNQALGIPPSLYFYFQLWNPHQPSTYNNGPTSFRISPLQPSSASAASGYPDGYIVSYIAPGIAYNFNPPKLYGATFTFSQPLVGSPGGPWLNETTPVPTPFYQYAPNQGIIYFTNSAGSYREPALMTNNASPMVRGTDPWDWNPTGGTNFAAICITNLSLPDPTNIDTLNYSTTLVSAGPRTNWGYITNQANWSAMGFQNPLPNNRPLPLYYVDVVWQGTFRAQFEYPTGSGNYYTYSTYLGMDDNNSITGFFNEQPMTTWAGVPTPWTSSNLYSGVGVQGYGELKSDPRTSRFGPGNARFGAVNADPSKGLTPTASSSGSFVTNYMDLYVPLVYNGGTTPYNAGYRMDMWSVNNPAVLPTGNFMPTTPTYITNSDGAVRPGDASYSYNSANSYATPLVQNDYANRPVILHRPFNSVGELGYAFRDDPWKTLDFFSPGSADAGLLDLFTLSEAPMLAGRVNPNTPYAPVAAAMINGALQGSYSSTLVAPTNAAALAQGLTNISSSSPFLNRADFERQFMNFMSTNGALPIKTEREAVMRAMADSANTRTWNFLVDIIAQSGTYPPPATTLDNFVVTGERHYWLNIAIDRYTGKVVDQQLESVNQ